MIPDVEFEEIRNEFIDESIDGLSGAADAVIAIEKRPDDKDIIAGIFRTVHSIKGNAAFFELMALKTLAHRLEDILNGIRNELILPDGVVANLLLEAVDALVSLLTRVREGRPEVEDAAAFDHLLSRLTAASELKTAAGDSMRRLRLLLASLASVPNVAVDHEAKQIVEDLLKTLADMGGEAAGGLAATRGDLEGGEVGQPSGPVAPPTPAAEAGKQIHKTMRIREESIDGFFKFVGELVVVGEMYEHVYSRLQSGRLEGTDIQLRRANESFRTLSMGLQQSILEIRKVPGKQLIGRAVRLVRDICAKTGKEIDVVLAGEDLMIDKAVAEALEAPLVHLVRNAADHGIEMPEPRLLLDKPRRGIVTVSLTAVENMIQLSVADDGRGIVHEKLREKAAAMGLIDAQRILSKDEVLSLLFHSGVSTAEAVTDISGRGVGMDVVRREIESMGGKIDMESGDGQGSRFTLRVPATVTTRIIQGIGVFSDASRYIVPVEAVVRFFEFEGAHIHAIGSDYRTIHLDGSTFPFVSLSDILRTSAGLGKGGVPASGIGVLVSKGRDCVAIKVDEVEANRQLVVKEIEGMDGKNPLFKGAAVTGDGTVSLVLDAATLISEVIARAPV